MALAASNICPEFAPQTVQAALPCAEKENWMHVTKVAQQQGSELAGMWVMVDKSRSVGECEGTTTWRVETRGVDKVA